MALITSARLIWSCACRSHADGSACPDTDCGSHADFGGGGEPAMEPMDDGGTSPCDCGGGTTGFRRLQGGGGGECDCPTYGDDGTTGPDFWGGTDDGTATGGGWGGEPAMEPMDNGGTDDYWGPSTTTTGGGGGGCDCAALNQYASTCNVAGAAAAHAAGDYDGMALASTGGEQDGCLDTGSCSSCADYISWGMLPAGGR